MSLPCHVYILYVILYVYLFLTSNIDSLIQAYDSHCNLVLGEVEETIYVVEEDDDEQEIVKVCPSW